MVSLLFPLVVTPAGFEPAHTAPETMRGLVAAPPRDLRKGHGWPRLAGGSIAILSRSWAMGVSAVVLQVSGVRASLAGGQVTDLVRLSTAASRCYRPRYLSIRRLNYRSTIRRSLARIAAT